MIYPENLAELRRESSRSKDLVNMHDTPEDQCFLPVKVIIYLNYSYVISVVMKSYL